MMDEDLKQTRKSFSKGLAGVSLIAEGNKAEIERILQAIEKGDDAVGELRDLLTRLDERVPPDLKERLAKLERTEETVREDTRRVRTLENNEAAGIKTDKRSAGKMQLIATVGAAIVSAIAAIAAAYMAMKSGG